MAATQRSNGSATDFKIANPGGSGLEARVTPST